jgi:hypothetical protein
MVKLKDSVFINQLAGTIRHRIQIISLVVVTCVLMVPCVPGQAVDDMNVTRLVLQARQGDVRAMDQLGILYTSGKGVEPDRREALMWFRRAAENGYVSSQYNYAVLLIDERKESLAINWLKKADANGHVRACHKLGELYHEGRGVPKSSDEAYEYFLRNARNGIPASMKWVAVLWQNGDGTERRPEDAAVIIEYLAELGDATSQVMMGNTYDAAVGVEKDDAKAIEWYLKAARQGSTTAMNNLGVMLSPRLLNDNPHADVVESFKWFNLAAGDGMEFAARQREKLRKHMTQEQVRRAEQESVAFIPEPQSWNDFRILKLPDRIAGLLRTQS